MFVTLPHKEKKTTIKWLVLCVVLNKKEGDVLVRLSKHQAKLRCHDNPLFAFFSYKMTLHYSIII